MKKYRGENGSGKMVKSGEFRAPKKGEYYLSGCKGYEVAYRAPNDLDMKFHIMVPFDESVIESKVKMLKALVAEVITDVCKTDRSIEKGMVVEAMESLLVDIKKL